MLDLDRALAAIDYAMLHIWMPASPFALGALKVRGRKRRPTIGAMMLATAAVAFLLAALFRSPDEGGVLVALYALYGAPILLAGLYVPRRWDLTVIAAWVALGWCLLAAVFYLL